MHHELADHLIKALESCDKAEELTSKFITFSSGGRPVKRRSSIEDLISEFADVNLSQTEYSADHRLDKVNRMTSTTVENSIEA